MYIILGLVFVPFLLTVALFLYFKWKFKFWKRYGIPYVEPAFPGGILQDLLFRKTHMTTLMLSCYKKLKGLGPLGGLFFFATPIAFILDLELVKRILVKDFNYFHDRGIYSNETDDPLSAHLGSLSGERWRRLRVKLTPAFTSGKLKKMFQIIAGVTENLRQKIEKEMETSSEIEMKDILARFGVDTIGTCAFGLDCNTLDDPEAEFLKNGRRYFKLSTWERFKQFFTLAMRNLATKLRVKWTPDEVSRFFLRVVEDTVKYREDNEIKRGDLMDLLINLKNEVTDDGEPPLTLKQVAAEAFFFYIAGFETSSTAMTFCLYELARNPDIQGKARESVLSTLAKYGGLMTFENLQEMGYLNQCIKEALRLYPPLHQIMRRCSEDYHIPEINFTMKKGQMVLISAFAIHRSPEHWTDPDTFDPERFRPEEEVNRNPMSFLAFGEGPRNCIAIRFGYMQVRVGLATILSNYRFSLSDMTEVPVKFSLGTPLLAVKGGIWLKLEKLEK